MSGLESDEEIMAAETPLSDKLADALILFWQETFRTDYSGFRRVLKGEETEHNRNYVYALEHKGRPVGSCQLTVPVIQPTLGGLGEVATGPADRGRGIAARLCARARDDFFGRGGRAVFLGTSNPTAIRVYERLGWRRLPGATVMCCTRDADCPEAVLDDDFQSPETIHIRPGSPAQRIPMIPLIVSPHDWQIMDANVGILSTRHAPQGSCMGLYPRYAALGGNGKGMWFAATTDTGHLFGLSTARGDPSGACQVDGFAHAADPGLWWDLLSAAIHWADRSGYERVWARVSTEDGEKMATFEGLGFRVTGEGEPFDVAGREVPAKRLEVRRRSRR